MDAPVAHQFPLFVLCIFDDPCIIGTAFVPRHRPEIICQCLRLQGFEDEQIDRILAINSDAQAYKQAGNSVTVTMIEAIGRRIRAVDEELRKEAAA